MVLEGTRFSLISSLTSARNAFPHPFLFEGPFKYLLQDVISPTCPGQVEHFLCGAPTLKLIYHYLLT